MCVFYIVKEEETVINDYRFHLEAKKIIIFRKMSRELKKRPFSTPMVVKL